MEAVIEDYAKEIGKLEDKLYWRFTLKKGVILAEASIHWAKECIGELEKEKSGSV